MGNHSLALAKVFPFSRAAPSLFTFALTRKQEAVFAYYDNVFEATTE
jgi:hypothetical protein